MKIHLEFDCNITKFFGIKMPQPYIEPEILTDSPMIQEVYSLGEDKSTGMLGHRELKIFSSLWLGLTLSYESKKNAHL